MGYKIYKYTFPNGKVYIGKTKTSIAHRAGSNGCRYGDNTLVGRAIRKYGWVNVVKEILYDDLTQEEVDEVERDTIRLYDSTNREKGYNLTRGGDGGSVCGHSVSVDTRKKIGEKNSVALKGRKVPQEQVERMRKTLMGHEVTPETREKIRKANIGKHHTEETKRKLSEIMRNRDPAIMERAKVKLRETQAERAQKRRATMRERYPDGYRLNEEQRMKLSSRLKGIPKSEETKQKMRKPKSPEAVEHMRQAQIISHKARKLGMTYAEYKEKFNT